METIFSMVVVVCVCVCVCVWGGGGGGGAGNLKVKNTDTAWTSAIYRVHSFSYFKYGIYKPREVKKIR